MIVKEMLEILAALPPEMNVAFNFDGEWRPVDFVEVRKGRWLPGPDGGLIDDDDGGDEAVVVF